MRYKIDKLVQLIMDYRGKTPKKLGMNWTENQCDIVALSAKNIKDNKIVNTDKSHYGSESLYKRWMKDGDIEPGDILITSEAPLGEVYLITKPIKAILSQRLFLLRFNKNIVNPWYIFAFMNSQSFKNKLFSKATGTTVVGIKQKELRKIEIDLPNIRLQNKVGDIFRVIYKKIIINEIINDNLGDYINENIYLIKLLLCCLVFCFHPYFEKFFEIWVLQLYQSFLQQLHLFLELKYSQCLEDKYVAVLILFGNQIFVSDGF